MTQTLTTRPATAAHLCDDRCSHRQTRETLTALGYPVRVVEKVVGSDVVLVEGSSFEDARHAAWADGAIRLCTRTGR